MPIKERFRRLITASSIILLMNCTLAGPVRAVQTKTSVIGSTNVTTADPTVPRPPGQPCVVKLFDNETFKDWSGHPYKYTPPESCTGKWSKVVLEADFSVTAGAQYDRTASLWLSGVNLYFGTTQEPNYGVAPSWHVERDLTEYSALLQKSGNGRTLLGNTVDSRYGVNGVIRGNAKLLFYPETILASAPRVPDEVYPLGDDVVGGTTSLKTSTDKLSKTLSLPGNVERAYLDVFAQSQIGDEFWWACVPDSKDTSHCGDAGNLRETEVSIDGVPAGVAPVYPWIYSGGYGPNFWQPITGVQTLNFMPYRVDLSPFAGVLSDGASHTVAVNVVGAHDYFDVTANLLVYLDPGSKQVVGKVTENTLTRIVLPATLTDRALGPTLAEKQITDGKGQRGRQIDTTLSQAFRITGYIETSHGTVTTAVTQTVDFGETHKVFGSSDAITQATQVQSASMSWLKGGLVLGEYLQNVNYSLGVDRSASTTFHQELKQHRELRRIDAPDADKTVFWTDVDNVMDSSSIGWKSSQSFSYRDSAGGCYQTNVEAKTGAVTGFVTGKGCPDGANTLQWNSHPDGSPDNSRDNFLDF